MRFICLIFLTLLSLESQADLKCNVDLNYGVVVNERHIRIVDESRTVYQINDAHQLIVLGNVVELDPRQQKDLQNFSRGMHYVVPKMIILATEGVELAVETVEHVYQGLVGDDNATYEKLQSSLEKVQKRVREKFIHANENYYMGPGRLENVNDLVDKEIEKQLEKAINTSVGGILSAIGGLTNGNDEVTNQKIEDLSQRLELMGLQLERQVAPRADSLRLKAQWFCNKMHYLDQVEEQLRAQIPELSKYNVIISATEQTPHKD